MGRSEQRRHGQSYLRGLMLGGKRKSIEPIAALLEDSDEQLLQQFINQSPWRWEPVRERQAVRMSAEIAPDAWIVDDTGFPKFGSLGAEPVARPSKHPVDVKLKIVLSVLSGEVSTAEAARRHGISETSIGNCKQQSLEAGRGGLEAGVKRGPTGREAAPKGAGRRADQHAR